MECWHGMLKCSVGVEIWHGVWSDGVESWHGALEWGLGMECWSEVFARILAWSVEWSLGMGC